VDKTRHYYTLCNAAPPVDTPPIPGSPVSTTQPWAVTNECNQSHALDDGIGEEHTFLEEDNMFEDNDGDNLGDTENFDDAESKSNDTIINTLEEKCKDEESPNGINKSNCNRENTQNGNKDVTDAEKEKKEDQGIIHDSPSSLHYRAGDEPEPIDLTHLNIEAAMMCLASKVRLICGKSDSPSMSSRTFRFKEVDSRRFIKNSESRNQLGDTEDEHRSSHGKTSDEKSKYTTFDTEFCEWTPFL
jgi:hypothetical protein